MINTYKYLAMSELMEGDMAFKKEIFLEFYKKTGS